MIHRLEKNLHHGNTAKAARPNWCRFSGKSVQSTWQQLCWELPEKPSGTLFHHFDGSYRFQGQCCGNGKKTGQDGTWHFPTRINIFTNVQRKCCYGWHRVKSCIFGFVIAGGRSLKQNLTSQILDLLGYIHVFKVWLKFFACDLPLLAAMCYCAITCTSNVVFIS